MINISHPTQADSLKPSVYTIATIAKKELSDEMHALSDRDNHDRWDRKYFFLAAEIVAWIEWKHADIVIRCDRWTIVAIADIAAIIWTQIFSRVARHAKKYYLSSHKTKNLILVRIKNLG